MEFVRKYKIENWDNAKEKLLLGIETMKENYDCKYSTMSRSDYKERDIKPVYWETMIDIIDVHLKDYVFGWKCSSYNIQSMWFAEYSHDGADFDWHTHEGCNMSGVLQIVIDDKKTSTSLLGQSIELDEGDLILFPSMLPHKGPKVTKGQKIVIGFNWDIFGSLLHNH